MWFCWNIGRPNARVMMGLQIDNSVYNIDVAYGHRVPHSHVALL